MTPPTDTAAALEAAIDKYTAAAIANAGSLGAPDEHAALSAAWCVVALEVENHVEAEVARRLAAAPEVEAAIETHGDACYERGFRHALKSDAVDSEPDAAYDRLRAAFAADKARAVEAAEDAAFIRGRDAVRKHPEGWGLVARPTPDEARRLAESILAAVDMHSRDQRAGVVERIILRALGVEA